MDINCKSIIKINQILIIILWLSNEIKDVYTFNSIDSKQLIIAIKNLNSD